MYNLLFDYYLTRFEVLVLFFLVCGAGAMVYWGIQRRWQNRQKVLEQELVDCKTMQFQKQQALEQELADCKTILFQKLHNNIQSAIAHEYRGSLEYISNRSIETLEELGKEQIALREKQEDILIKAQESIQHAANIMYVFAPLKEHKTEVLNIKQLVQGVLKELFNYAKNKGVTLRPDLEDVNPTILNMDLTVLTICNVIHNAIKYSDRGRVVEISLALEEDETRAGKVIAIHVKDMGRGIKGENKDTVFELSVRGDGVTEPGHGLGLYCARKAARLQGGDVILVSSSLNQGSAFKIILPYSDL